MKNASGARPASALLPPGFGPAGTADSFSAMGYRRMDQIPEYLQRFGLTAFEYQCGHGLRVNLDTLRAIGAGCAAAGIAVSLHAPYYISLSSREEEKRDNSIGYILESARLVRELGGVRVVVHSGSAGKLPREEALALAKDTLRRAQEALDGEGLAEVRLCPETMGKVNQLGSLEETLALCAMDERFLPTVDFGHLNARTFGGLREKIDFANILDAIRDALGTERERCFHAHFSKIAYTIPGGEKNHLTFADTEFGPRFEPLLELLAARSLAPTIICESAGTQSEDARTMQDYYRTLRAGSG